MTTWDYWFAVDPDKQEYHAFYLQFPKSMLDNSDTRHLQHENQAVGHAISTDLLTWTTTEDALRPITGTFNNTGIATEAERCETTQHWEHNDKWYMYTGITNLAGWIENNYIPMADKFDGPYELKEWSNVNLPDGKKFYIGKRIVAFDEQEYFLAGENYNSLSIPYRIVYDTDGKISLHTYDSGETNFSEQNKDLKQVLIYPNPAQETLTITLNQRAPSAIEIFDYSGSWVYVSGKVYTDQTIDINQLGGKGIYLVRVNDTTKKLIANKT